MNEICECVQKNHTSSWKIVASNNRLNVKYTAILVCLATSKQKQPDFAKPVLILSHFVKFVLNYILVRKRPKIIRYVKTLDTVSYTHLTLPTICSV